MTTEEKAKAYDEAIKKAESLYKASEPMSGCNVIIETLFPELKESEDEKILVIIKHCIECRYRETSAIQGISMEQCFAWLERQGEYANFRNKIQVGDKVTRNEDGVLVNLSQLKRVAKPSKKQGEQKPQRMVSAEAKEVMYDKPAWSEEDEFELECVLCHLRNYLHKDSYIHYEDWLKSLKDRVGCEANCTTTKEWSEEDEEMLNSTISFVEHSAFTTIGKGKNNVIAWLKSLRPQNRWKPSEGDIIILEKVFKGELEPKIFQATLYGILEQLKKLKEE